MKLNVYQNVKSPDVLTDIEATLLFSKIKGIGINPSFKDNIIKLRELNKKDPLYKQIKEILPAVTYNFLFVKRKKNENILSPTGLLFFDIDNPSFSPTTFVENNKGKIYAMYKSCGGKGYSIIVKVEGLTLQNFTKATEYIAGVLNIENFIDRQALKPTQFSVISYDPDIYIEYKSESFSLSFLNDNSINEKSITTLTYREEKKGHYSNLGKEKKEYICSSVPFLKFEVQLEHYEEDCVYIPEGKDFYKTYLPFFDKENGITKKIKEGRRENILSCYLNNLLCLNDNVQYELAINIIKDLNSSYCDPPLSHNQIISIVKYKIAKKSAGELDPLNVYKKKYWINPSTINKKEAYHKKRKEYSMNAIEDFFGNEILNINKKITYAVIVEYTGVSLITIKRNITEEQKSLIKEINSNLKKK